MLIIDIEQQASGNLGESKKNMPLMIQGIFEQVQRFAPRSDILSDRLVPVLSNSSQNSIEAHYQRLKNFKSKTSVSRRVGTRYAVVSLLMGAIVFWMMSLERQENSNFIRGSLLFLLVAFCGIVAADAFCVCVPFESFGLFALPKPDRRLIQLYRQFERVIASEIQDISHYYPSKLTQADFFELSALLRGIHAVSFHCFDCISLSGLVILLLVCEKTPVTIERFYLNNSNDGHSFVVINREVSSNAQKIEQWNSDCWIIDPWYNVCVSVENIHNDPDFFRKYPLLTPENKQSSKPVLAINPPPMYQDLSEKLLTVLASETSLKFKAACKHR